MAGMYAFAGPKAHKESNELIAEFDYFNYE